MRKENFGIRGVWDYYVDVVGRETIQENGHRQVEKAWVQGEHPDLSDEIIEGSTGPVTVVYRHNIAARWEPPRWVVPLAAQETESAKTLWVRGHMPFNGERIKGMSGPETVLRMRKVTMSEGVDYQLVRNTQSLQRRS